MSITQSSSFEQLFKIVEGIAAKDGQRFDGKYWEYKDFNGNFLGLIVRTEKIPTGKDVRPWCLIDGKWKSKGFWGDSKPIYGIEKLKQHPKRKIMFVEGEKTTDAAQKLFPEMNVVCWQGGSAAAKKADLSKFQNAHIYLVPDNDDAGYRAMDIIAERLFEQSNTLFMVDIRKIGVEDKWDIADLDNESGEVEPDHVRGFILATKKYLPIFPEMDHSTYPDLSEGKNPRPLDTTDNVIALLNHFKIKVAWNMMKRIRDVYVPSIIFYDEESENASLTYITNLAIKNGLKPNRIDKHLDSIAWSNTYHPIRDWILKEPLQDKSIFNKFLQCIQTTNNDLSYILIKRWMISAIAALFNDSDFCTQGVLVIQGEPGTHKSSFIMSLVPNELSAIKGGTSLDPTKKDDILTLAAYWIAELGELDATFRKADIARLKSHITNDVDDVRRAYASRNSRMIRRTVYAATVNDDKFLVDTTGNRRWWTISITEPINTRHRLNMQQVWRCMYDMWTNGESPNLLENEMKLLNQSNKEFEYIDPMLEKLEVEFNWEWKDRIWMNSTQVLERIGYTNINTSQSTKMGRILSKKQLVKKILRGISYYHMPIFKLDDGGH